MLDEMKMLMMDIERGLSLNICLDFALTEALWTSPTSPGHPWPIWS